MTDENFQKFETERLIVRRFEARDAEDFLALRSIPEVLRYQRWNRAFDLAAAEEFAAGMMAAHPDTPDAWYQFAVTLREDGRFIGDLAARFDYPEEGRAELGYSLFPEFQGQGYAREAVAALLDYLFQARGKRRVIAQIDVRNRPSIALVEALGFRREAHLIECTEVRGEICDDYLYALLAREWASR